MKKYEQGFFIRKYNSLNMKIILAYILCFFCLIFLPSLNVTGQTYLNQFHSKKAHSPTLEGSLHILNLCEEQPEHIQQIFKTAFEVLEKDPRNSFADLAEHDLFVQLCRENGMTHTGGPMLGNATSEGVDIWVRTLTPSNVEARVTADGKVKSFGPVTSTLQSDLVAVVQVNGLKSDTRHSYEIFIDGKPADIQKDSFFRTLPEADSKDRYSIAFGTCFHRWGLCNTKLANQIKSREPMALLLGGDIAAQDRNNNIAMHRADYLLRDFHSAWKNLAANIPVYATWDDHDYFDNDLYNIPEGYTKKDKESVSDIFRNSWNNPPYGSGENGFGVFFRTRIGPADVIMLDNRYFREKGNFLGDEQMQWLEEQLLDCKGPFIILSNGTMFSDYVSDGKDSWGTFDPEGREKIFSLIEKNNIGGVLLISGDRHGARGFKIPRPSGFNFYEFEMGSLGGRVGPPPIRADWDTQIYGISGEYAFGEFTFDTTLPDPEVTFRLIHESGTIFYELTLSKSQLTPQKE